MLIILHPDTRQDSDAYRTTMQFLENLPGVSMRLHEVQGKQQHLTEIYLLGDTKALDKDQIAALPAVERAVRISDDYRMLGRHRDEHRHIGFDIQGPDLRSGQPACLCRPMCRGYARTR